MPSNSRYTRYTGCNEIVTKKPQHGKGVDCLVNVVTLSQNIVHSRTTDGHAHTRALTPYYVRESCNDVNEVVRCPPVVRLSRYKDGVTSVTKRRSLTREGWS